MTWPNGDFYQGMFVNGRANGKGIFTTASNVKY